MHDRATVCGSSHEYGIFFCFSYYFTKIVGLAIFTDEEKSAPYWEAFLPKYNDGYFSDEMQKKEGLQKALSLWITVLARLIPLRYHFIPCP